MFNVFLSSVNRASFYNLVHIINLVQNSFFLCLFVFSKCSGQICAHHQEKYLYQYDTWYLSLCVDDRLVCIPVGLCVFISILYMFGAIMCPSSGERTVSIRHLVFVTLCG
jgi:hypothetical protein